MWLWSIWNVASGTEKPNFRFCFHSFTLKRGWLRARQQCRSSLHLLLFCFCSLRLKCPSMLFLSLCNFTSYLHEDPNTSLTSPKKLNVPPHAPPRAWPIPWLESTHYVAVIVYPYACLPTRVWALERVLSCCPILTLRLAQNKHVIYIWINLIG